MMLNTKNQRSILFSDKPFCRKQQQDVYGVATGEVIRISCDVFADPSRSVKFEWAFNTSTEWYRKQPENVIGINLSLIHI